MYTIKIEQFEGPMDLLLQLIEKNELDITRLSLASVADQFVEYMEAHSALPLEQMADFLDTAARLLLLKSKALLPVLQFTEEEEEEIVDLEERLKLHALFKEKAIFLGGHFEDDRCMFSREAFMGLESLFLPDKESLKIASEDLYGSLKKLLDALPDPEKLKEKVLQKTIRLEERIRGLKQLIAQRLKCTFFEIIQDRGDRGEIVVSFLAVLELVRQKHMVVRQDDSFGDMYIEKVSEEF